MKTILIFSLVLLTAGCVRGGQGLRVDLVKGTTKLKVMSDRNYDGGYVLEYKNPQTGEEFKFEPKGVQNSEAQGYETLNKALDKIPNAIDLLPGQTAVPWPSRDGVPTHLIKGGQ